MSKIIKYKDIDFNFNFHPITSELITVKNNDSIKQSIKSLITTSFYDRPFQPRIGSQIKGLLFESTSELTVQAIRTVIARVLNQYEPRIQVIDIVVVINDNETKYDVVVIYTLKNATEVLTVKEFLTRVK